MKYTDKALLRKLVENEGVFLHLDVDVLSFFQVTVFCCYQSRLAFPGKSELCCLQFHDAFLSLG